MEMYVSYWVRPGVELFQNAKKEKRLQSFSIDEIDALLVVPRGGASVDNNVEHEELSRSFLSNWTVLRGETTLLFRGDEPSRTYRCGVDAPDVWTGKFL